MSQQRANDTLHAFFAFDKTKMPKNKNSKGTKRKATAPALAKRKAAAPALAKRKSTAPAPAEAAAVPAAVVPRTPVPSSPVAKATTPAAAVAAVVQAGTVAHRVPAAASPVRNTGTALVVAIAARATVPSPAVVSQGNGNEAPPVLKIYLGGYSL